MRIPTTIRRQDSGKMCASFGVMWKPGKKENINLFSILVGLNPRLFDCEPSWLPNRSLLSLLMETFFMFPLIITVIRNTKLGKR